MAGRRLTIVVLSLSLVPLCLGRAAAQRASAPPRPRPPAQVSVGVLPFTNVLNDAELASLGGGISHSLTNALKSSAALTVADAEVVAEAARRPAAGGGARGDAGALELARLLGLRMVVVGSYQRVGRTLRAEAYVLSVDLDRPLSGPPLRVAQPYPDGYSDLLDQLAQGLVGALEVPLTPVESEGIRGAARGAPRPRAQALYDSGLAEARKGTKEGLMSAVRLLEQAVALDPNFALAYAAKAEAELELLKFAQAGGREADDLGRAALADARAASARAPTSGAGPLAEARVHNARGNYAEAEEAARTAARRWPGDAAARLELGRARGRGRLTPNPDVQAALASQPWLALRLPGLPKVLVRNERDEALVVTFTPRGTGAGYPPVGVPAHSSRIVAVLPGDYRVTARGPDGDELREATLEAGREYDLLYTSYNSSFDIHNVGRVTADVQIRGPRNVDLSLRADGKEMIPVPAGEYTVTLSGANVRPVSETYQMGEGDKKEIDVKIIRGVVRMSTREPPAPVGRSAFLVTNTGGIPATIRFTGPKSFSVTVGGYASRRVDAPPGEYTISVIARGQQLRQDFYTLGDDEEYVYRFVVVIRRR